MSERMGWEFPSRNLPVWALCVLEITFALNLMDNYKKISEPYTLHITVYTWTPNICSQTQIEVWVCKLRFSLSCRLRWFWSSFFSSISPSCPNAWKTTIWSRMCVSKHLFGSFTVIPLGHLSIPSPLSSFIRFVTQLSTTVPMSISCSLRTHQQVFA